MPDPTFDSHDACAFVRRASRSPEACVYAASVASWAHFPNPGSHSECQHLAIAGRVGSDSVPSCRERDADQPRPRAGRKPVRRELSADCEKPATEDVSATLGPALAGRLGRGAAPADSAVDGRGAAECGLRRARRAASGLGAGAASSLSCAVTRQLDRERRFATGSVLQHTTIRQQQCQRRLRAAADLGACWQ